MQPDLASTNWFRATGFSLDTNFSSRVDVETVIAEGPSLVYEATFREGDIVYLLRYEPNNPDYMLDVEVSQPRPSSDIEITSALRYLQPKDMGLEFNAAAIPTIQITIGDSSRGINEEVTAPVKDSDWLVRPYVRNCGALSFDESTHQAKLFVTTEENDYELSDKFPFAQIGDRIVKGSYQWHDYTFIENPRTLPIVTLDLVLIANMNTTGLHLYDNFKDFSDIPYSQIGYFVHRVCFPFRMGGLPWQDISELTEQLQANPGAFVALQRYIKTLGIMSTFRIPTDTEVREINNLS